MAVHDRRFQRYKGPTTDPALRFLVLPHYIFKDIFKSKLLVFGYAFCLIQPLILAIRIYVANNLGLFESFVPVSGELGDFLRIKAEHFQIFLYFQGGLAFILTLVVGPGLISRDLANNGLPLYLSRPISRSEYVLGKISVIFILLSGVTWVPGLMLFGLQSLLDDGGWMSENIRVAFGLFVGACVWILFLGLLAAALSAWVKWKPVAAFLMFMIFGTGTFFSTIVNLLFFRDAERDWGYVFDPGRLIAIIWSGLLGTPAPDGPPIAVAWIAFAAMAVFLLFVLNRKLRAYEVVT